MDRRSPGRRDGRFRPARGLWLGPLLLLACRHGTPPPVAPPPAAPEPAVEAPVVPEARPPAPAPGAPPVVGMVERETEIPVRVGLLTDAAEMAFPCCDLVLRASVDGRPVAEAPGLRVVPAAGRVEGDVFRLQVAALRDRATAEALAARLGRETGHPAEAVPDAASGLYRVRVGAWRDRAAAEATGRALAERGVAKGWVIAEGGAVEAPALQLVNGSEAIRVTGRWLDFERVAGEGIPVGDGRYRGRIRIYLNDRGLLNVINELPLESYLRGVVPREMGPSAYAALAALQAQTVAARTYTVRNLGDFAREGYDLCPTPRCQVYGGMGAEHSLSDEAVASTRGVVMLWQGRPIDALYSSTCGGHTEDVETVFPGKDDERYLRGVPCVEAGETIVEAPAGPELVDLLLGAEAPVGSDAERFAVRLTTLARRAGLAAPPAAVPALDAAQVHRAVAATFDLALEPALLGARPGAAPAAPVSPRGRRLAATLAALAPDADLDAAARRDLLLGLAEAVGVVDREPVRFVRRADGGGLVVRRPDGSLATLPADLPGYRGPVATARAGALRLAAGDVLELFLRRTRVPAAIVQPEYAPPTSRILYSKWRSWERFKTDAELAASVAARVPGFGFQDFEVLERGVSGRVGRLRLRGAGGRTEVVEGLAVRWTLDLPDTLFTARRTSNARGAQGWAFSGHGLGHGVGLCQIGAYGMARRGLRYEEILSWYYWGAELGTVSAVQATVRQAAR